MGLWFVGFGFGFLLAALIAVSWRVLVAWFIWILWVAHGDPFRAGDLVAPILGVVWIFCVWCCLRVAVCVLGCRYLRFSVWMSYVDLCGFGCLVAGFCSCIIWLF